MRKLLTSDHRSHFYRRSKTRALRNASAFQKETLSVFRIYETSERRELALKAMIAYGFKYFVVFKDVSGFGLQGCFHAQWQNTNSAVHIDR